MSVVTAQPFVDSWRRRKSAAFDLAYNSTGGGTIEVDFRGVRRQVYINANLSIYSGQTCNARCPFCVEELRPAARGSILEYQKTVETDDARYFEALKSALDVTAPLRPSVSVTGGEPSNDPRLPRILSMIAERGARKRTVTTNGSGLLDVRDGRRVIDWIANTGVRHLNISIAHPDEDRNARIMGFTEGLTKVQLKVIVCAAHAAGTRVRLSCVLLKDSIENVAGILEYLEFARSVGVDNVIFRQLMKTDPMMHSTNHVVKYSDSRRILLEPILESIAADPRFDFQRQIVGYYYYVEVWRARDIDVVFEEADLAQLERTKRSMPGIIHELVFHPNGHLASTWQPWDGVLI
ncbi:MAG TPA: radical SAM protein [Blastocatellia bacterium]